MYNSFIGLKVASRDPASPRKDPPCFFEACCVKRGLYFSELLRSRQSSHRLLTFHLPEHYQAIDRPAHRHPKLANDRERKLKMNRGAYRPPQSSRASASTLCQKCLKRDKSYFCVIPKLILTFKHATTATNAKRQRKTDHTSRDHHERSN